MKTNELIENLISSFPNIEFASEHWRIYEEFVRSLMHEEGVLHPREYRDQQAVKLVCAQHPFSFEECINDPKGVERKQREYTAEWVRFLNGEKLPLREVDICSSVNQKVFDALCAQQSIESLRIKWLRCARIDRIPRLKKLKKLYIGRALSLVDISPIAKLESLETLILCEPKKVFDFSALGELKKLRVLGICASRTENTTVKIKDTDFISQMPALEYVDIMDVRL